MCRKCTVKKLEIVGSSLAERRTRDVEAVCWYMC